MAKKLNADLAPRLMVAGPKTATTKKREDLWTWCYIGTMQSVHHLWQVMEHWSDPKWVAVIQCDLNPEDGEPIQSTCKVVFTSYVGYGLRRALLFVEKEVFKDMTSENPEIKKLRDADKAAAKRRRQLDKEKAAKKAEKAKTSAKPSAKKPTPSAPIKPAPATNGRTKHPGKVDPNHAKDVQFLSSKRPDLYAAFQRGALQFKVALAEARKNPTPPKKIAHKPAPTTNGKANGKPAMAKVTVAKKTTDQLASERKHRIVNI